MATFGRAPGRELGLFSCSIPPGFVISHNMPTINTTSDWLLFGRFSIHRQTNWQRANGARSRRAVPLFQYGTKLGDWFRKNNASVHRRWTGGQKEGVKTKAVPTGCSPKNSSIIRCCTRCMSGSPKKRTTAASIPAVISPKEFPAVTRSGVVDFRHPKQTQHATLQPAHLSSEDHSRSPSNLQRVPLHILEQFDQPASRGMATLLNASLGAQTCWSGGRVICIMVRIGWEREICSEERRGNAQGFYRVAGSEAAERGTPSSPEAR